MTKTKKDIKEKEKNKKNVKGKTKSKEKKESFVKGIKKEIKLVKWPDKQEIIKYTISTLVFCIVVALFFVLLTYLLSVIKGV